MKFHDVIGDDPMNVEKGGHGKNAVVAAYEGAWTKLEMVLIT
jgi:hypothetical protein